MLSRNLLLLIGAIFILTGLGLSAMLAKRASVPSRTETAAEQEAKRPAVLVALHPAPAGTLLRPGDLGWKDLAPGQAHPHGALLRGQANENEYLGAITRRDFAEGEPIVAADMVKPTDRRFLSAVLKPDHRAVSISVDAPQSASGLVLPGDYVDVILTQAFGDGVVNPGRRTVAETVLRAVRVVAVDQSLGPKPEAIVIAPTSSKSAATTAEPRLPRTISLELNERQAQALFVAMQIGKLQLAVRPLEGSGLARAESKHVTAPTWAAEVSPALREVALTIRTSTSTQEQSTSTGSTVESAVRRPPPASR